MILINRSSYPKVLVAGDITEDRNLAIRPGKFGRQTCQSTNELGGAAMLYRLIAEVHECELGDKPEILALLDYQKGSERSGCRQSFVIWKKVPMHNKFRGIQPDDVWRVSEPLGLSDNLVPIHQSALQDGDIDLIQKRSSEPRIKRGDIVVISDTCLEFQSDRDAWPKALERTSNNSDGPWLVLKTNFLTMRRASAGKNHLVEYLTEYPKRRSIIVINVDRLRRSGAVISEGLSWEKAIEDLAIELRDGGTLRELAVACKYLIVTFEADGAVLITREFDERSEVDDQESLGYSMKLVYDPEAIEGDWIDGGTGTVLGITSCAVAAVVRSILLAQGGPTPDLTDALVRGLQAMRRLFNFGYGAGDQNSLRFPAKEVAQYLRDAAPYESPSSGGSREKAVSRISVVDIDVDDVLRQVAPSTLRWRILSRKENELQSCLDALIEGIEKADPGIPVGRFGKLVTVDRQEIEGYRSIQSVVGEYCRKDSVSRPLSISVFGQPGSGKSFGIKQVLHSIGVSFDEITFNLSQFSDPIELLGALHQVRDIGLRGALPLVFWDEFDSSLGDLSLGWLRYFLEPMQDGQFLEGQVTHPIGKAVFVFIGGTATSLREFEDFSKKTEDDTKNFKRVKGPDFVSRLKGSISIMGPNQIEISGSQNVEDHLWRYRRAISLRSVLQTHAEHLFERSGGEGTLAIDNSVAYALLSVPEFLHGTRSMEAIVAMSRLTGRPRFEPSYLPSKEQLTQHIEGDIDLLLRKGRNALMGHLKMTSDK